MQVRPWSSKGISHTARRGAIGNSSTEVQAQMGTVEDIPRLKMYSFRYLARIYVGGSIRKNP